MLEWLGYFVTAVGEILMSNLGLFCMGTLAILSIEPAPKKERFY